MRTEVREGFMRLAPQTGKIRGDIGRSRTHLSQIAGIFLDQEAVKRMVAADNPLVYEVYRTKPPASAEHMSLGTSIIYPGMVGTEYFMTKGHLHVRSSAEVYYCLSGSGFLVMETPEGRSKTVRMDEGAVVHVPPGWGHRTCNTGDKPFVCFYVFRADAGHDYRGFDRNGAMARIVQVNGRAVVRLPSSGTRRGR